VKQISTTDWITIAEKVGAPIVMAIIDAMHRRGALVEVTPEVADMSPTELEAFFGRLRQAGDRLSDAGASLVEHGAAEKGAGG
jgi:hypothetical protein